MEFAYLDHAATTPMRAEAVAAMMPYLSDIYANPSGGHRHARQARKAIEEARDVIAEVCGCAPGEVIFTGGGTEADNTAILGTLHRRGGTAVCPAAEHHAVLHAVESVKGTVVANDSTGHVDLDSLADGLGTEPNVGVVSVMAVNNEVGTVTRISEVAGIVRDLAPHAVLHTDAVQAGPWLDLRPIVAAVDLLSLSAHKFGGPKGVGVLVARTASFDPLLIGGGQERERRSGTHNVPGIVAMAEALRLTDAERDEANARTAARRERLVGSVVAALPDAVETVAADRKVPGSAHLCFPGVENEALLYLLDEAGVCASAASSCASGAMEPSHVLAAMGVPRSLAGGAVRLTLGPSTTDAEVDRAVEALVGGVRRLRQR